MKATAALLVLTTTLLPAPRPPAPPSLVRSAATALGCATRREADSLRVWVRWPASRPAPGALRVQALSSSGAPLPWADSVRLRPMGPLVGSFTVAMTALGPADRLRLYEGGPDAPAPTDVPVAPTTAARTRTYALADTAGWPLCRAWLRTEERVKPLNFGLEIPLTLLRYSAEFQPALPPMAVGGRAATSATLAVTETHALNPTDPFRIPQPGLYALRQGADGPLTPLLVEDGGFPDIRTAPDLIRPLVYLTTVQERQTLYNAPDPKQATDRFWLDAAQGETEVARGLIRAWYGRVAEANRLFSAHKPGWMTDRGLLWVVLGPPPHVEATPEGEDWVYRNVAGTSGARFRFRRRPSLFAPDHYELHRERSHEDVWYAATSQWRRGQAVVGVR